MKIQRNVIVIFQNARSKEAILEVSQEKKVIYVKDQESKWNLTFVSQSESRKVIE